MLFASPFPCAVIAAVCVCSYPAASLHVLNKRDRNGCPSYSALPFVDCQALSFLFFISETSYIPFLPTTVALFNIIANQEESNIPFVVLGNHLYSALRHFFRLLVVVVIAWLHPRTSLKFLVINPHTLLDTQLPCTHRGPQPCRTSRRSWAITPSSPTTTSAVFSGEECLSQSRIVKLTKTNLSSTMSVVSSTLEN
jgi:hypothetical protein